jgi:Tetratricopeptide repeat
MVAGALPAVLAHPDPWTRAVGLGIRSRWRLEGGDLAEAERDSADSVAALRRVGDRWALAMMLGSQAEIHGLRRSRPGDRLAARSGGAGRGVGRRRRHAAGPVRPALQRAETGDLAGAREELDRAAAMPSNSPQMRRFILAIAEADLARMAGDPATAIPVYHQALEMAPHVRGLPGEVGSLILLSLVRALIAAGDLDEARRHVKTVREQVHNRLFLATLAEVAAALAVAEGAHRRAAHLLGCAEAVRGTANLDSREVAATVATVRSALDPDECARGYATAAAYPIDAARKALGVQVLRR